MAILTAEQRTEISDKIVLLQATLATYSSAAFQTSLTTNVEDAQAVDDGIAALYNTIDTNIIRAYENERLNLNGSFVLRNISDFYTGESDEIVALGELSDNYIENIITPVIIAIAEADSSNVPSNVDPDNAIFRTDGKLDAIPANARRMFPASGTAIRRITQFEVGANTTTTPINSGTFNTREILLCEDFLLQYELNSTAGGSTTNAGGSTFVQSSVGPDIGTLTGVIRSASFTPPSVTNGSTPITVTLSPNDRFVVNSTLWQIIVGGTGTGAEMAGMMDPGTAASPGSCTAIALSTPNTFSGISSSGSPSTAAQVALIRAAQLPILALERGFLVINQDQLTNDNATAITNIDARTMFLGGGAGTDLSTRISQIVTRADTQIDGKIGTMGSLSGNYDQRYEFANQRANFANGTIGGLASAIATRETFLLPSGSEILSLQAEIQDLQDAIDFSDNFVP